MSCEARAHARAIGPKPATWSQCPEEEASLHQSIWVTMAME